MILCNPEDRLPARSWSRRYYGIPCKSGFTVSKVGFGTPDSWIGGSGHVV